jgi:AcrR family transcriptional regulator
MPLDGPIKGNYIVTDKDLLETTMAMGRPREFDIDKALGRAMEVFWRKGYEGASLSDLTQAMGINPPSLYAAFGNKEGLFCRALDRYAEGPTAFRSGALLEPTARQVVESLLEGTVAHLSNPRHPKGCLLVQGALSAGDAASAVRDELIRRRAEGEAALRQRLERAQAEGDLPVGADPAGLARYLSAVTQGMAVLAAGGATRAELKDVAATALHIWPK